MRWTTPSAPSAGPCTGCPGTPGRRFSGELTSGHRCTVLAHPIRGYKTSNLAAGRTLLTNAPHRTNNGMDPMMKIKRTRTATRPGPFGDRGEFGGVGTFRTDRRRLRWLAIIALVAAGCGGSNGSKTASDGAPDYGWRRQGGGVRQGQRQAPRHGMRAAERRCRNRSATPPWARLLSIAPCFGCCARRGPDRGAGGPSRWPPPSPWGRSRPPAIIRLVSPDGRACRYRRTGQHDADQVIYRAD